MTAEEFIETVKVGDYLKGYSTGKIVQVTGIGETRFFYRDEYRRSEYVSNMSSQMAKWRKVDGAKKLQTESCEELRTQHPEQAAGSVEPLQPDMGKIPIRIP